jgi:hypothetical protein
MATPPEAGCILCGSHAVEGFAHVHGRDYYVCRVCRLVFMSPADRPAPGAERARYEAHRNDPADAGYRNFLDRLRQPLVARLPPAASGLDYGSGPGPTLYIMFRELGFELANYDPFFAPDPALLERTWDYVTCTETVEHFFSPATEFDRFDRLLVAGGWLGVMTEMRQDDRAFETWWYVRDATHVCFYHRATMAWIADHFGWSMERPHRNVTLFHKAL